MSIQEQNRPLLVYLQGTLPSLNPAERLIAEYVLEDPERVLSSSIGQIREGAGASVGSIVGFCRRLGLKGFGEFKIALARELAQGGFSGGAAESGKPGSIFEQVFQFHARSLTETARINQPAKLQAAARALDRARRVEVFSIGMSYPVAYAAVAKFTIIGVPASTQCDAHMQLAAATRLRKGDVAFGISCSGQTSETVRCLEVARAKRATTICLTNSMRSAITKHADICLFATPSEVKYFQAPLASRVTQLAVVDALFVWLAQRHKDRTTRNLQAAAEQLLARRLA